MKHKASCHCGKVAIEFESEIENALSCNCSICQRKGSLLLFVPLDNATVHGADGDFTTYTFNKHVIKHRFCKVCGVQPFGEGVDPKGARVAAVNIRCIDGLDLSKIPVHHYDGRSV